MSSTWSKWTDGIVRKQHGHILMYRKLYDGEHAEIFPRAKKLIEKGEILDNVTKGEYSAQQVQTPYIVANVCKMIVDVPAILVSRAIGQVNTSKKIDDFIAAPDGAQQIVTDQNGKVMSPLEMQKDAIKGIVRRSNLNLEHKTNIIHHQMDGGIVGVPYDGGNGIRIEFKSRDVYFPHQDNMGADLVYEIEVENDETDELLSTSTDKYLHVYTEELTTENINGQNVDGLSTYHTLYAIGESGDLSLVEDPILIQDVLNVDVQNNFYAGRDKLFISYWPNDKTFIHPLGRSALHNQANKQDEINWTLTRNSITFERNGKPRIAVSKEIFSALQDAAFDRYGDEKKIDARDLEITTFDDKGKALEIIQVDITKIGDINWVKDIMKIMLMETMTSEKAIDFYMDGQNAAQSGVSKFYDLFTSILKADQLTSEYINFIQDLFENCLWIENQDNKAIQIERPEVQVREMVPISRKELIEQESTAFKNGTQSLESTVKKQNANASEEWINDELTAIEQGNQSIDTASLMGAKQTVATLMDNRFPNGQPNGQQQSGQQQGNNNGGNGNGQ